MTILIDLLGAPSVGKSTTAGRLFAKLKGMELNVEFVQEFVKQWVYLGRKVGPYDQFFLFGQEVHNQSHLFNKVDYIISDSPVILAAFYHLYNCKNDVLREACKNFYDMAEHKDNVKVLNFYLPRKKKYQNQGRFHTKEQADEIDHLLRSYLDVEGYPYEELDCPDEDRVDEIMKRLRMVTGDLNGLAWV